MERKSGRTIQHRVELPRVLNVTAYARVSSGKDAMLQSLSSQISYYSKLIQNHPGWQYAGVYSDEAYTGTRDNRPGFQRLMEDCRAGKVDLVLVKSISRFARNTVTLLEAIRELKALGVDIFFENENIHTLSAQGELILTIVGAIAQEQSRSVSENCKWRIRTDFADGIPNGIKVLGYRFIDGKFRIIPKEAEIVKMIFADYLSGMGRTAIAKKLREMDAVTRFGGDWNVSTVFYILRNIMYVGDLHLQKSYIADHLKKDLVPNNGELPSYFVQDNHEPIIDRDTFDRVQGEIVQRQNMSRNTVGRGKQAYPFSGLLVCGCCGKHYRRKINSAGTKYAKAVWICDTCNTWGKAKCASKQIPESILEQCVSDVLGADWPRSAPLSDQIGRIFVPTANLLIFELVDGQAIKREWKDRSRSESWDEAARIRASEQTKARYGK